MSMDCEHCWETPCICNNLEMLEQRRKEGLDHAEFTQKKIKVSEDRRRMMNTLDDQIAILQAAKEGKKIQMRAAPRVDSNTINAWYDVADPGRWNFTGLYEYRVKPMDRKVQFYMTPEVAVAGGPKGDAMWAFLRANGRIKETLGSRVEATFNAEGELIRVELI